MSSMILSQKHCEKKLREIRALKQKQKHNSEELGKIQKEKYYEDTIKRLYRKVLDVLPDDVQQYILGFVDTNTRLKFLKTIYTPDFVNANLSSLCNNRVTIKKLFSCLKYVRRIFTEYFPKDGNIYREWGYYVEDCKYYPKNLEYFMQRPPRNNKRYYVDILISIIIICIKNYTRIYATNDNDIHEREKDMIKLFSRIKSM